MKRANRVPEAVMLSSGIGSIIRACGNIGLRELIISEEKNLIGHLTHHGAFLLREGRRHSIYQRDKYRTQIPRHAEIVDELARKICKDLNIPFPR